MKFGLLLCCLMAFQAVFYAQADKRYLDSLKSYLAKKDDSLKLLAISDLAWEYNYTDVSEAIQLNFKGLRIARKLNRSYAVGQAYSDLGTSYYYKRDFDSSAYYYLLALPITKKVNDSVELASLYNKLGALYKERAEYKTSLYYSFLSLKLYQALKQPHKIALLYNNIGVSYEELKNFKLAKNYYQRALIVNKKDGDKGGMARNYIGLGNVSITEGKLDQAYDYYQKASVIFEELGWGIEYSVAMNNMGDVLDKKKLYAESVKRRQTALDVAKEIGDIQGEAKYHLYLSDALMNLKKFPEALKHIRDAEKLSKEIQSYEIEMDLYEMYSKYYFGINQFEQGSGYLNKFHDLKDSVYSSELSTSIASMEVKHNTQQLRIRNAEAEARNLKLSNDNLRATQQRNYIISGAVVLLLLGGLVFYRSSQKLKRIEERKRINAVFQSEETERTRIARDLHDGLGQLLSSARINAAALDGGVDTEDEPILKTTLQLIDQSISEVRTISHNLMPSSLVDKGLKEALIELKEFTNSGKGPQITIVAVENLPNVDQSVQMTLFRVIQEIVNNMLKHAEAKNIQLSFEQMENTFQITLKDDGTGFDVAKIETSSGIGWKNIQTRLSLIQASMQVSSTIGQGSLVIIEMKMHD